MRHLTARGRDGASPRESATCPGRRLAPGRVRKDGHDDATRSVSDTGSAPAAWSARKPPDLRPRGDDNAALLVRFTAGDEFADGQPRPSPFERSYRVDGLHLDDHGVVDSRTEPVGFSIAPEIAENVVPISYLR